MIPMFNSLFSVGYTLLMSQRAVRAAPREDGREVIRGLAHRWARTLCERCGVRVRAFGADEVDLTQPLLLVANHQSYFDIPVLTVGTGRFFAFLAKKELFRVPRFGKAIRGAGAVSIDRGDRTRAHASLDEAVKAVQGGAQLAVFPEGTRARHGELLPFKKGAFYLAQRAGVPILPVGIVGTGRVLPKSGFFIRPGEVDVHIGKPIRCAGDDDEARERLRLEVRDTIAAMTGFAPV